MVAKRPEQYDEIKKPAQPNLFRPAMYNTDRRKIDVISLRKKVKFLTFMYMYMGGSFMRTDSRASTRQSFEDLDG
jgi:hypothetical protein